MYISLIGDFNGRTADEDDFVFSSENHGYDAARFIENDVLTLDELHIPRKRKKHYNLYVNKCLVLKTFYLYKLSCRINLKCNVHTIFNFCFTYTLYKLAYIIYHYK